MAQFKKGQRVRIVGCSDPDHREFIGKEGTVVTGRSHPGVHPDFDYGVDIDGLPSGGIWGDWWCVKAGHLAPLTDPDDAWATEAVRKVTKPQHMEQPVKTPAGNFVLIWP